ncbi:hypothetical protein G6F46_003248 [Rhizopus delemar]|nr:hypothetical protein G6F54_002666 [Rhizopus delemar]KAG1600310.1 hypothetical protein G6F47_004714 [Rhizopus delemar]KAG1619322.1 hypothetical protein G6F46_003248 [Rhizopus delemar]
MSDAGQEVNEVDQAATDTGEQTSNNVENLKKRIISTSKLFQYLKAAKQDVDTKAEKIQELKTQLEAAEKITELRNKEYQQLEERYKLLLSSKGEDPTELKNKAKMLEQTIEKLKHEKAAVESSVNSSQSYIKQLEAKCESLNEAVKKKGASSSISSKQIADQKQLHQELAKKSKEFDQLKAQLEEERNEKEQVDDELMELQINHDMLKTKHNETSEELQVYKSKCDSLEHECKKLRSSNTELESRLITAEKRATDAESTTAEQKKYTPSFTIEHSTSQNKLNERLRLARAELKLVKFENESLRNQIKAMYLRQESIDSLSGSDEDVNVEVALSSTQMATTSSPVFTQPIETTPKSMCKQPQTQHIPSTQASHVTRRISTSSVQSPPYINNSSSSPCFEMPTVTPEIIRRQSLANKTPTTSSSTSPTILRKENPVETVDKIAYRVSGLIPPPPVLSPTTKKPSTKPRSKLAKFVNSRNPSKMISSNPIPLHKKQPHNPVNNSTTVNTTPVNSTSANITNVNSTPITSGPATNTPVNNTPASNRSDNNVSNNNRRVNILPANNIPTDIIHMISASSNSTPVSSTSANVKSENNASANNVSVNNKRVNADSTVATSDQPIKKKQRPDVQYLKIADQSINTKYTVPTYINLSAELSYVLSEMETCFEKIKSAASPSTPSDSTYGIPGGVRISVPSTIDKREKSYAWLLWALAREDMTAYDKTLKSLFQIIIERIKSTRPQSTLMRYIRTVSILCKESSDVERMRTLCYDVIRYSRCIANTMTCLLNVACIYSDSLEIKETNQKIGECLLHKSICSIAVSIINTTQKENIKEIYFKIASICQWPSINDTPSLNTAVDLVTNTLKDPRFKELYDKDKVAFEDLKFCIIKSLELLLSTMDNWTFVYDEYIRGTLWPLLGEEVLDNVCLELFAVLGSLGQNKPGIMALVQKFLDVLKAKQVKDVEIYQLTAANGLILLSQDKPEFMKIAVDWLNNFS